MGAETNEMADGGREPTNEGQQKGKREVGVPLPQVHLAACVPIVRAIHEVGGNACEWDQVAVKLELAPKGGRFRLLMLASRWFKLLNYRGQDVTLSNLGVGLLDAGTHKSSLVAAFLSVDLYRKLYEDWKGSPLPPAPAIENRMVAEGVTRAQAARSRQRFIRSARDAGFFEMGRDRLVKPSLVRQDSASSSDQVGKDAQPTDPRGDSGARPTPSGLQLPRLVEDTLAKMPITQELEEMLSWDRWLKGFVTVLGMEYPDRTVLQNLEIRTTNVTNVRSEE